MVPMGQLNSDVWTRPTKQGKWEKIFVRSRDTAFRDKFEGQRFARYLAGLGYTRLYPERVEALAKQKRGALLTAMRVSERLAGL